MTTTQPRRKRLLFIALALLAGIAGGEAALQILSLCSIRIEILIFPAHQTVPDERLGHRPNPDFPGHDRKGFRNPGVPDAPWIVALGDSQTYGTSLPSEHAWPRCLERLGGRPVYSMAFGGYGPAHGLLLLREALELRPEVIIYSLYSGNDCHDSFRLVHGLGKLPDLLPADPAVLAAIDAAERVCTLERISLRTGGVAWADHPAPVAGVRTFLSAHSALYGLARAAMRAGTAPGGWEEILEEARLHPSSCVPLDAGGVRTILLPAHRLAALDPLDPRISDGIRISLECLSRMSDEASRRGAAFLVLFIPTAELVFEDAAAGASMPAVYGHLLESEKSFWARTREHLASRSIPYADALPALRRRIRAGRQPYPAGPDGHPNPAGSAAIAETVLEALGAAASPAQGGR